MTFKSDIVDRINTDFGETTTEAKKIIVDAISKDDNLKSDRVIRCIIYLAKGDLEDLNNYIMSAIVDTRDVMFWAEYSGINEGKKPMHLRDFSKTFDECSNEL